MQVVRDHRPIIDWVEARVSPVMEHQLVAQGLAQHPPQDITFQSGSAASLIGAPAVWNGTAGTAATGKGIEIAVIDSGIDYLHSDLGGCFGPGCKVAGGYDHGSDDTDPMDEHGHGTHVAAIAAGNGTLKGIAPSASLFSYKVSNQGWIFMHSIVSALVHAMDPNGDGDTSDHHDVILMALSCPISSCGTYGPLRDAVDQAVASGAIVVASAGNGPFMGYLSVPGAWPGVLSVGASTLQDELGPGTGAWFSGYGPATQKGLTHFKPDLVAPGVAICAARASVVGSGTSYECHDADHIALSGTSMSAAVGAGAVALLLEQNPNQGADEIRSRLRVSAVDTDLTIPNYQGAGRLDVAGAATMDALTSVPHPTVHSSTDPRFKVDVHGTGTVSWTLERAPCDCNAYWSRSVEEWQVIATGNLTTPGTFDEPLTQSPSGWDQLFRVRFLDDRGIEAVEHMMQTQRSTPETTGYHPLQDAVVSTSSWNNAANAATFDGTPAWTANIDPTQPVEWVEVSVSMDGGATWTGGVREPLNHYFEHDWLHYGWPIETPGKTLADVQANDVMARVVASTGQVQEIRNVQLPGDPDLPLKKLDIQVSIRLENYAPGWREPVVVDVEETIDFDQARQDVEGVGAALHQQVCNIPLACVIENPFQTINNPQEAEHKVCRDQGICVNQWIESTMQTVDQSVQLLCDSLDGGCGPAAPPSFPSDPCSLLDGGCPDPCSLLDGGCPDPCSLLDGGCPDPCPYPGGCPNPELSELDPENPPGAITVGAYQEEDQPWWRLELTGASARAHIPDQPTNNVAYNFETHQIINRTTCIAECREVAVDASGAAPIFAVKGYQLSDPYYGTNFQGNHETVSIVRCLDADCNQTTSRVLDGNAPCPTNCHHKWNTGHGVQIQRTSDDKVLLTYAGNQFFDGTFSLFVTACQDANCSGDVEYRIVAGARNGCPAACAHEDQQAFKSRIGISPTGDTVLAYQYQAYAGWEHFGLGFIRCHTPDCMGDLTRTNLLGANCAPQGCENVQHKTFDRSDIYWRDGLPVIVVYPSLEVIGPGMARPSGEPVIIECHDRDCSEATYRVLRDKDVKAGRFGFNPDGPSTFAFSDQGAVFSAAELGRCLSQWCTEKHWNPFSTGGVAFDGGLSCPLGCDPWSKSVLGPAVSHVAYNDTGIPWVLFSTYNNRDLRFVQCGDTTCGPGNSYQHLDGHSGCISIGCDPLRSLYNFDVDTDPNGRTHVVYADGEGAYLTRRS